MARRTQARQHQQGSSQRAQSSVHARRLVADAPSAGAQGARRHGGAKRVVALHGRRSIAEANVAGASTSSADHLRRDVPPTAWAIGLAEQLGAPVPVSPVPDDACAGGQRHSTPQHRRKHPQRITQDHAPAKPRWRLASHAAAWSAVRARLSLGGDAARGVVTAGVAQVTAGACRAYRGASNALVPWVRLCALTTQRCVRVSAQGVRAYVWPWWRGLGWRLAHLPLPQPPQLPKWRRWCQSALRAGALAAVAVAVVALVMVATAQVNKSDALGQFDAWALSGKPAQSATSTGSRLVIQSGPRVATPANAVPNTTYVVGAWLSNMSPPRSGVVTLYVRVTNVTLNAPVMGIPVTATVQFTCADPLQTQVLGPVATSSDGIGTIPIAYSDLPVGAPVCVAVSATVGGASYAATTTFATR